MVCFLAKPELEFYENCDLQDRCILHLVSGIPYVFRGLDLAHTISVLSLVLCTATDSAHTYHDKYVTITTSFVTAVLEAHVCKLPPLLTLLRKHGWVSFV